MLIAGIVGAVVVVGLVLMFVMGRSGGSDDGVKAYNTDPSADITSHEDGDELLSGYSIIFKGSVSDVNHNNGDLKVTWLTDNTELCPEQNAATPMLVSLRPKQDAATPLLFS